MNSRSGPKGKRRKARGRRATPAALAELKALLGPNPPLERQYLIEHLHLIQDVKGHVPAALLVALAERMGLSLSDVFETVRFYAHFDFVEEGEAPPPPITIQVCASLPCALSGASELAQGLRAAAGEHVRIIEAPCMGGCDGAPFAMAGRRRVPRAEAGGLLELAGEGRLSAVIPAFEDFGACMKQGGYKAFGRVRRGEEGLERIVARLEASGLRGLGGAGFPAAAKWRAVAAAEGAVKYVVVNADESEPGSFKDRHILERWPHRVLEGALIAAEALRAQGIFIYLREEHAHIHSILSREIALLEDLNIVAKRFIRLRRGAGAYVCGEESALIESLEGRRGWPRQRPPYVSEKGLFGRPTLVHNVETLYRVAAILGGDEGAGGRRFYSVSGRVRRPGVHEAPCGATAAELIELAGGMAEGHELFAFLPGGASGGILPASLAHVPLTNEALGEHGAAAGAGALIVLSRSDDVRAAARAMMAFFAGESCGQCTPCREGCARALRLMEAEEWDEALLEDLAHVMGEASICGLGRAAPASFLSILRHFPAKEAS